MTDQPPKVSILVVSYNTRDMTLECLESIYANTTLPFELIVVDNASGDGSAEAIRTRFPDAILLAETENHGFARANNLAAQHATSDLLLLLNPDTLVLETAIDELVRFSETCPDARIWGGRTLFGDRSLNPTSCWRRMTVWGLFCRATGLTRIFPESATFNPEAYGGWQRDEVRNVDIVTGCFLLISRGDWNALGGFDEKFHMYGEEVDLNLRATAQLGAKPMITPHATIVHYGGASDTVRPDKTVRVFKAKMELLKRHLPGWRGKLGFVLFCAGPFWRALILGLIRPNSDSALTWKEVWKRRAEWRNGFETA